MIYGFPLDSQIQFGRKSRHRILDDHMTLSPHLVTIPGDTLAFYDYVTARPLHFLRRLRVQERYII